LAAAETSEEPALAAMTAELAMAEAAVEMAPVAKATLTPGAITEVVAAE
jgi:hypothetical protein